ncbi:MAG: A/G-specific adenine glycosylase [Lachnospiraceae bacterium]|nr:A/G-specific adenine glycosylase [Lachnospiraceae bacterium]
MIDTFDLNILVEPALKWFYENKRDLPWRQGRNPYGIWVSEIMLQQTRVEAVIPYYQRFMEALPDIEALAKCPEDRLLKLWEGLGYYNRVRNMQKAARVIVEEYGGEMPGTYQRIVSLPGIGPYTAGAIASIAFGEKVPAVDGNVLRILSRVAEDDRDILKESTKKSVTAALQRIMPEAAGDFNQALMEIGALVCIPNGEPKCQQCPWQFCCEAYAHQSYDRLPVKTKAKARRIEERTVLLIRDGQRILLGKRPAKGLLAGLYELPNLTGHRKEEEILEFAKAQGLMPLHIEKLPEAKHIFSHIEWHMIGYMVQVADVDSYHATAEGCLPSDCLLVDLDQVQREYAIPTAFEKYVEFVSLKLGPEKNTF